jgi:hypothetical protein
MNRYQSVYVFFSISWITVVGLVSYNMLQERLISTGELDAGGSVLMIEHMEKTGKIEQTEDYHVYRMRTAASRELKHNKIMM